MNCIMSLGELIENSDAPLRAWLYIRKSNRRRGNAHQQLAKVKEDLKALRVIIVDSTMCVETSDINGHRPKLAMALQMASENGAILVAATRDRFIRNGEYDNTHRTEQPTSWEYRRLHDLTLAAGVTLATILRPDASPSQNRSSQVRRGQCMANRPGGRPIVRRDPFREKWLPFARKLSKAGRSLREIAAEVSGMGGRPVTHTTIGNWLKRPDSQDSQFALAKDCKVSLGQQTQPQTEFPAFYGESEQLALLPSYPDTITTHAPLLASDHSTAEDEANERLARQLYQHRLQRGAPI